MKKSPLIHIPALLLAAFAATHAEESSNVEFKRVSISGQFDNGQIVSGKTSSYEATAKNIDFNGEYFQRMGVWITQSAVVNSRLELTMGAGGIFWYSMPTLSSRIETRQTQFGPGISQAQGVYTFGDLQNPSAKLQMGFFPYKYNPDAKNLGEYLMRSGTYPGYVMTGGWSMFNSAGFMAQGARLNLPLWDGKFQSDFLLTMETTLPPLFSITPAYVASVTPVSGLRLGAGIACNHCLPVKPSVDSPRDPDGNNYVISSVTYDTANATYVFNRDSSERYTFKGVKVMASASVDPKAYIPMDFLGPEDLKIYGEIAVLGWKNYPYYYEKRTERMPMMVGFNAPTRFGSVKLLDALSFELEYLNSAFVNDITQPLYGGLPIWNVPTDSAGYAAYQSTAKRDNWKWSVFASREITKGIQISAQAASDHFRPIHVLEGVSPTMVPVTNRNGKEWYYLVRLQFGI
jgi:hypothetical protein